MPINFAPTGSVGVTKAPRVIQVFDTVSGCPPTRSANPIMSATFTVASTSVVVVQGEIIRARYFGSQTRCDLTLYGPGYPGANSDSYIGEQPLDGILDWWDEFNTEWDNACFRWMGYVPAGTHTFYTSVSCLNYYGCTSPWGQMHIMIFE